MDTRWAYSHLGMELPSSLQSQLEERGKSMSSALSAFVAAAEVLPGQGVPRADCSAPSEAGESIASGATARTSQTRSTEYSQASTVKEGFSGGASAGSKARGGKSDALTRKQTTTSPPTAMGNQFASLLSLDEASDSSDGGDESMQKAHFDIQNTTVCVDLYSVERSRSIQLQASSSEAADGAKPSSSSLC